LSNTGEAAKALGLFVESQQLFERLGEQGELMASSSLTKQADSFSMLGRLDEAEAKYNEGIKRAERLEAFREVAVGKMQLATLHLDKEHYNDALAGYKEALNTFERLKEPVSVAKVWHRIGMVHQRIEQYEDAETAYRRSLEINTQCSNMTGQAMCLGQLGYLYGYKLNRLEDAIVFSRQAADLYAELEDKRHEGITRNNIASALLQLKRYDEARQEIKRAIECKEQIGLAAHPWKTFDILHDIEAAEGNADAAKAAWSKAAGYLSCLPAARRLCAS
ncbi:MAG: tetratricopeptide repeat protein, partial [Candidatus Electrothrix sp. AUS1_2]|nr:tetratricopeptide repeat protein [Candidatus Electrothrix sp. AUS1_2]